MNERIKVWVQKFKDRPTLMLQWHDPVTGKRKSKSAETSDPDKAEHKRADLESDLNNGRYQENNKLDWETFRERFEAEYLSGLRERSREKYQTVLDTFESIIDPERLGTVTERTLSAFKTGLLTHKHHGKVGCQPVTIKNYLVAIRTALKWAVEQRFLSALPTFPTVQVPKKKPQPVPVESFEKLLDKAPTEQWRTFLLCGWWAGLRLSEALSLRWQATDKLPWVDFEGNRIVIPADFAKGKTDQYIPLHPVLRQALAALPRTNAEVFTFRSKKTGGRPCRAGVSAIVRAFAKAAGVRLCYHKLRKGFGCRVAKTLGKGGAAMLHELMRHSSMQVTMDYYANVDDALQEAIVRLT